MHFPMPPTPTGSLSSGEIREILELESESEEEESLVGTPEEQEGEDRVEVGRIEGDGAGQEGVQEPKTAGKEVVQDPSLGVQAGTKSSSRGEIPTGTALASSTVSRVVTVTSAGKPTSINSVPDSSHGVQQISVPVGMSDVVKEEVEHKADMADEIESSEEEEDEESESESDEDDDDDDDESDDDDDDDEDDDDDIDIDMLDLGVDLDKAKDQPSQLALARASIKPKSPQREEGNQQSGEAQLEVLELELRARAIRALMHKCLTEDDKS